MSAEVTLQGEPIADPPAAPVGPGMEGLSPGKLAWRRLKRNKTAMGSLSIVIGIVACTFTAAGLHLGKRLGTVFGKRMEVVGGLVLVAIGAQRLVDDGRRWAMPLVAGLVVLSVAINAWGVAWGTLLGW